MPNAPASDCGSVLCSDAMCGFVGIVDRQDVAGNVHLGLQALQHRGQDSAGIATMADDGRRFFMRRGLGTVTQALGEADVATLIGPVGIGHVRYPTVGQGSIDDTQPFFYRVPGVLMAHNGNLTNFEELQGNLRERSIHLLSRCDVEPALCEFADHLMHLRQANHRLEDAIASLREMQRRIRGAYSIVAALMLDGIPTLVAFRDPYGIRPATIGSRGDSWIAASETVAFDALDGKFEFEPMPGEAVFLRAGEKPIRQMIAGRNPAPCVFEQIYFARPDAQMAERSVYQVRLSLGHELAKLIQRKDVVPDVIVPVPDTARPAATAIAETLGVPLREGFIKNRYSGRTFIMPDAIARTAALRLKLNPIPSEIAGKRVLLVDDSIVRGTTLRRVIALVRHAGAREVHHALNYPPVRHPCFYGIDMSTTDELFAHRFPAETLEVDAACELGAETLTYLTVEGMNRALGHPRCGACFDGVYPEPLSSKDQDSIISDRSRIAR